MKLSLIAALVLFGAMLIPGVASAQSAGPSFSISINAKDSAFKIGSEIPISVSLKNISGKDMDIAHANGARAEFDYTINVKNAESGKAPQETEYSAAVHGRHIDKPGATTQLVVLYSWGWRTLKAGDTINDTLSLTKLYDVSQPGSYTIQLERKDDVTNTIVKSNKITVTVTP